MKRRNRRITIALAAGGILFASPIHAEDDMTPGAGEMEMEDLEPLDAARQQLSDTATRDDAMAIEAAESRLAETEQALQEAVDAGAEPDVIAALEAERDAAQRAVDRESGEEAALHEALLAMSDDQVDATNRALNNAVRNGTITDLDAATLEDIAERDLNAREIQALTKALEEEAKFEKLGGRFEQKYDETGKDQFRENRDRMVDRGERQRDKFERKVDRMVEARDSARDEMRSATRNEARESARRDATAEAKRVAREEAQRENRGNGRGRN